MHDSLMVRGLERVGDFGQQSDGFPHRQLAPLAEPFAESLAFDVRHHVVEETGRIARVEQAEDMGVLESRGDLDLPPKAVRPECGRELWAQHFDGDFAPVLEIFRQIDRRHAARSELALEPVAVAQGVGERSYLSQTAHRSR
jgi:hypothetical protein